MLHDYKLWIFFQMLCMIGEAFDEYSDDVCGAVMNIRPKGDKIGIWTGDGTRTNSIMEIGLEVFC